MTILPQVPNLREDKQSERSLQAALLEIIALRITSNNRVSLPAIGQPLAG
jgi:hypothetical protein